MNNAMEDDLTSTMRDDGLQRDEGDDAPAPAPATPGQPSPVNLGYLLTAPPKKAAKRAVKLRTEQKEAISRDRATWKRNVWWREGKRWVKLEKKQDTNLWRAVLPSGMANMPPVPNKTDRLCRRLVNVMLVDPPFPECEPSGDSSAARETAEFSTRYLVDLSQPSKLNLRRVVRAAASKAQTFGSAFGWVITDPGGAGARPRPFEAHPLATTKENAYLNPTTGLPASEDELQERYLTAAGGLTDDPGQADLQWLPGPKVRLLTGLQCRLLPPTATSLRDAAGIHITDFTTLGDLKRMFPSQMAALSEEQLTKLCKWRPDDVEDILPPYTKLPEDCLEKDGKSYRDEQLVFITTIYYGQCSEYPKGAYIVVGGDSMILHRQTWTAKMAVAPAPDGSPRPAQQVVLKIPVSQCRCLDDDITDNPMGIGIAEMLGPADEIAASALGFQLEYMFRAGNPHTFLPIGTVVQPKQLQLRDGTPILVNPLGKPEVEQIPALSSTIPELREEMQQDQNDAIGLQQAAQGVEDPSVKSGIHAQTIVQEALKAVSDMKDNIGDFYVTLCDILIEQARAYAAIPTILAIPGPDGAYKAKEWSRIDLGTTERTTIKLGAFTMHGLIAKQEMANNALDRKTIDVDDYNEIMSGGISPILGAQDNPNLLRIRRQIGTFKEGPPPAWLQAYQQGQQAYQQQLEQMKVQAGLATLTAPAGALPAAPMAPPPPPPLPPGVFKRLPVDLEPMPAKIRHRQLSREMASAWFEAMPEPWQQSYFAEHAEMANAAGVMTVPQVQKAQAMAPPALPHGVTIAMKGDAATVAAEEKAAVSGISGGGAAPPPAPGAPAAGAPAAPPAIPQPA